MSDSLVSVIIPCLNVEDYIEDCLYSVLAQGRVVRDVFVVDNGSSDSTVSKVEAWGVAHPECSLKILSSNTKGAPAARNLPINQVRTDWIQFLDADDILLPGKLQQQMNHITPHADVLVDTYLLLNGNRNRVFKITTAEEVEVGLMQSALGVTSSNLWRTEMVINVDGWQESQSSSQEYDLMLRMYQNGAVFRFIDSTRTLVQGRIHGQISQSDPQMRWQTFVETRVRILASVNFSVLSSDSQYKVLDGLFFGLRMLYPFDSVMSLRYHDQYLVSRGFRPRPSSHSGRLYCLIYRLIGFVRVEALKRVIKGG